MGFIGKHRHTLDPKGRVFVPKKFLAALPESEPRHFVVTKGFDGCLTLYTAASWKEAVERMQSKAQGEAEVRAFKRVIFSSASLQALDGSGRILIPEELRQEAHITRDVVFVGIEDMIELWDFEEWKAYYGVVKPDFEKSGKGMF